MCVAYELLVTELAVCRPGGKIVEPWLGTGDLILIRSSGSWISGRAVAE